MNPRAIYSKSGKGVQEASGKTSLLKRGDRAVLSAIDGRATLGEVAQKVGKSFDPEFEQLIRQLDKDGFVREVTAGGSSTQPRPAAAPSPPRTSAPPARAPAPSRPAPPPSSDAGADLDFTTILPAVKPAAPKPQQPIPAPAKAQESALYKAREEAEARAQAERERMRLELEGKARAEAEAKIRAETEKKVREEAEARLKTEAEAKAKAAREAALRIAAEAKAKAEEVERKAKEEAEKARREAEELRQKLEEEQLRRKEEEERRLREEQARREREANEAQARQAIEQARREEEDRRLRDKEQEASRLREEEAERARKALQETRTREPTLRAEPAPKPSGGSLDALMADLDSFSQREEQERETREAAERKVRDEKKRRSQDESERRAAEQAAHEARQKALAAEEQRRAQEEERRAQEEAERRVREAEEQRNFEAEERKRRARESLAARQAQPSAPSPGAVAPSDDIGVSDADLDMDDVRRDEAAVAKETRKQQREREREARQREREARERAQASQREEPVRYSRPRRSVKWGRPVAMFLFTVLVIAIAALHIVPLPMAEYEEAASEALGRPVKIGSGKLSLFTGVRLNLEDVTVGDDVKIATVHAYPHIGSLIDEKKAFHRIELEGVTLPQHAIAGTVSAKMRGDHFNAGRIVVKSLRLVGPVPLPTFEADAVLGPDGVLRNVTLRGPDSLNAKLTPTSSGEMEFDVTASSVAVPFAAEVTLSSFAMKGIASRQGMNIAAWGGAALDGALSGTANVRWSGNWQIDGAMTARGINAAVFAPALLSEGKAEASGRFSMSGSDPAKLANAARIDGNFTVGKGVLGTFDLSRVLQTGGRQYGGRTPFMGMTGRGTYERGAVALRDINITAGALNAGASADISQNGALSGRIVADIRTSAQPLRAVVVLGGTVREPQVRN
jgi:hypothetical protein